MRCLFLVLFAVVSCTSYSQNRKVMMFTECSLQGAIKLASTNPARLMGLEDRGEVAVGKRADLILFTIEDGEMIIQKTMVAGKVVYSRGQDTTS